MNNDSFISKASIASAILFLAISVSSVRAEGGFSLGNIIKSAVIHKVAGHNLPLSSNPLNGKGMMMELPEPTSLPLVALGGLVGFAAWQWRRRSAGKTN